MVALDHGKLAQFTRRNDKRQFRSVELGIHQLGLHRIRHIPHLRLGGCLLKDEAGDITYGGNTAEKGTSPIGFQGALSLHTDVVQAHVLVSGRTVLHLCTERFALFACPGTNPRIGNGLGVVVALGTVPDGTVQDALVTDAEADCPVAGSGFSYKTQGHFPLFIRYAGHREGKTLGQVGVERFPKQLPARFIERDQLLLVQLVVVKLTNRQCGTLHTGNSFHLFGFR